MKKILSLFLTASLLFSVLSQLEVKASIEYTKDGIPYYVDRTEIELRNRNNYLELAKIPTDKNEPVLRYRWPNELKNLFKTEDSRNVYNFPGYLHVDRGINPAKTQYINAVINSTLTQPTGVFSANGEVMAKYTIDYDFDPKINFCAFIEGDVDYAGTDKKEFDELLDLVMNNQRVVLILPKYHTDENGKVVFSKSTAMKTFMRKDGAVLRYPLDYVIVQIEGYTKDRKKILLPGYVEADYKDVKEAYEFYGKQSLYEKEVYYTVKYKDKTEKLRMLSIDWSNTVYITTVVNKLLNGNGNVYIGLSYSATASLCGHLITDPGKYIEYRFDKKAIVDDKNKTITILD